MPRKISETLRMIRDVKQNAGIRFGAEMVYDQVDAFNKDYHDFRDALPKKDEVMPETAIDTLNLTFVVRRANFDDYGIEIKRVFESGATFPLQIDVEKTLLTLEKTLHVWGNYWGAEKGIVFISAPTEASNMNTLTFRVGTLHSVKDDESDDEVGNREVTRLKREINLRNKRLGLIYPIDIGGEKRCEECSKEYLPARSNQKFCSVRCETKSNARRRRIK